MNAHLPRLIGSGPDYLPNRSNAANFPPKPFPIQGKAADSFQNTSRNDINLGTYHIENKVVGAQGLESWTC